MPDVKTVSGRWQQRPTWAAIKMDIRRGQVSADSLVRGTTEDPDFDMVEMPASRHPELINCFASKDDPIPPVKKTKAPAENQPAKIIKSVPKKKGDTRTSLDGKIKKESGQVRRN